MHVIRNTANNLIFLPFKKYFFFVTEPLYEPVQPSLRHFVRPSPSGVFFFLSKNQRYIFEFWHSGVIADFIKSLNYLSEFLFVFSVFLSLFVCLKCLIYPFVHMSNSLSFLICDLDHSYGQFVLVPLCIWKPTIFDIHQYLDRSQLLYKMVSQDKMVSFPTKKSYFTNLSMYPNTFNKSKYLIYFLCANRALRYQLI